MAKTENQIKQFFSSFLQRCAAAAASHKEFNFPQIWGWIESHMEIHSRRHLIKNAKWNER